jgi:micrococcal nuclease
VTDRGFDSTVIDKSEDCLIKGNINREGKKIYHVPDEQYYIQTNPEDWFCTEAEASAAGFKKSGQ